MKVAEWHRRQNELIKRNDTVKMTNYLALTKDIETDVCIVGGGIGGLTTAYLLQREGEKVCLLESDAIGSGQTGRTTAHFVTAIDSRYFNLEKFHGEAGSKAAADSHVTAPERVQQIVNDEKIDCDLEWLDGYLMEGDEDPEILDSELKAVKCAGIKGVHLLPRAPSIFFHDNN